MSNFKPITVEGTIHWAFLDRLPEQGNKYQADVCNLSDKAVKALEEFGVKIKNKGDARGNYVTGKSTKEIIPLDATGKPLDLKGALVGNGSKAKVVLGFYSHAYTAKYGTGVGLNRLTITDFIPYGSGAMTEDELMDDVL